MIVARQFIAWIARKQDPSRRERYDLVPLSFCATESLNAPDINDLWGVGCRL